MRLTGKVIAITGGGLGIGRACALAYAREGARVAVTDIDMAAADEVMNAIDASGGEARAWRLDVTEHEEAEAVVAEIVRAFGRLDTWHNNAGVSSMSRFVDVAEADWETTMDVNAKGVFLCSQVVARYFIEHRIKGRIINTASMAGKKGAALYLSPYVASKFAVVGLTQAMASELAPFGITVNSICPGFVATAMQEREVAWEAVLRGSNPDAVRETYVADTPLQRMETADDVAGVAVFLASDDAAFITGESINVNGGAFME